MYYNECQEITKIYNDYFLDYISDNYYNIGVSYKIQSGACENRTHGSGCEAPCRAPATSPDFCILIVPKWIVLIEI